MCFITLNVFIRLFLLLDLYAFIIGSYVIWTAVAGLRYSLDQIRKRRISVLLGQVWKWCSIVVKSSALLSIWVRMILVADIVNKHDLLIMDWFVFSFGWSTCVLLFQIFVIPVLIGLLFELLVIVPMRVPVDESPVFLLYQDWALGLIFLKIWTRLVSLLCLFCISIVKLLLLGFYSCMSETIISLFGNDMLQSSFFLLYKFGYSAVLK